MIAKATQIPERSGLFRALRRPVRLLARRLAPHPWLALPFLALPALWPFWSLGLPHSADGPYHLIRLILLDRALQQGVLYPRWLPDLVLGNGYPLFSFYGPASYYLPEALHLIGFSFVSALMTAFAVFVLLAGAGMYLFACAVFGPTRRAAALLAAVTYMYAPYFLTNVFIRGAIAEVAAQALLPWIMWATWRLMTGERPARYLLPVALSLGGLAATHNITTIFVPPLWIAYAGLLWRRGGFEKGRLAWAGSAVLAALGISAFFWLPLLLERQYLADVAYGISTQYLNENAWTWSTILGNTFNFRYTFDIPFRLGIVQLSLAVVGFVLARRRDALWLLFLILTVIAGLMIGAWALPIWLNSQILRVAQFPWRLLSFIGLFLALFTGGAVARLRPAWLTAGVTVLLLAVVVTANRPRIDWLATLAPATDPYALPAIAQFELDTGAFGTSSAAEFRPRWNLPMSFVPSPDITPGTAHVQVQQANDFDLVADVSSAAGGPLRLTTAYFPGWRARLDGTQDLPVYPGTNMGLLTVDVPAGEHQLHISWEGTADQRFAGLATLLTLALLTAFCGARREGRLFAFLPAMLFVIGVWAAVHRAPLLPVSSGGSTGAPLAAVPGIELVGMRVDDRPGAAVAIYPYWYVRQTPSPSFRVRWQLRDAADRVVAQAEARPHFDAASAGNWPPGTLVDDAYQLPLPPGLAAGDYRIALQLPEGQGWQAPALVGGLHLAASAPSDRLPAHPLDLVFDHDIELAGYDAGQGNGQAGGTGHPLVLRAGDWLDYALYWHAGEPPATNYHSFLHLVDKDGVTLVTEDQMAGKIFSPPRLWSAEHVYPDIYRLRIPDLAPSGLYWPSVGLYDFAMRERLQVRGRGVGEASDDAKLPPIKIIGRQPPAPRTPAYARFGDLAELQGYDLDGPTGDLHPGSEFTVTLHYRSLAATAVNFTHFAHLFDAGLGMAGQKDAPPQDGANPTSAWVPGELIVDRVVLKVGRDARPGTYHLQIGFYDPAGGGARLAPVDRQGRPFSDAQVDLGPLEIKN